MLKYKILLAVVLLAVLPACKQKSPQQTKEPTIFSSENTTDTLSIIQEEQTAVTLRFLELVRHIDSSGYIFDTTRYAPVGPDSTILLEGYVFFERTIEDNIIFYDEQTDGSHPFHEIIRDFNIQPFKKRLSLLLTISDKKNRILLVIKNGIQTEL